MAFMHSSEVSLKATGSTVTVANDPRAKLMYYLDCICNVLEIEDNDDIDRLRRYRNYWSLSRSDKRLLLVVCLLVKPDVLIGKCIFQNDRMCGDSTNEFYRIEAVRNSLMVAGSVMIGGQRKRVTKIMTFKMSWLNNNFIRPIEQLLDEIGEERAALERSRSWCVVM